MINMALLKNISKLVGWLTASLVMIAFVIYAVLFVINWKDQPPSTLVTEFNKLYQNRSVIQDRGNAYLYLLGFSGDPETDPMELGVRRRDWILQVLGDTDISLDSDPLVSDYNYKDKRDESVADLSEACSTIDIHCLTALETNHEVIQHWLGSERWLLDRYKALIKIVDFNEAMPFDVRVPLPSYSVAFEGQKLYFMETWVQAKLGDTEHVNNALHKDLAFWRMVLENSDSLITKMIAIAGITRHLKLGNLVLRNFAQTKSRNIIPTIWFQPVTDDERSMKRTVIGEWLYLDRSIRNATDEEHGPGSLKSLTCDESATDCLSWYFIKPFWQPQDTINLYADQMNTISILFEAPYTELDDVLIRARALDEELNKLPINTYNIVGKMTASGSYENYAQYAVRVSDVEGVRRAVVLASELRASTANLTEIVTQLETSAIRNPYNGEAFEWDDDLKAVVFTGLESSERGRHAILY